MSGPRRDPNPQHPSNDEPRDLTDTDETLSEWELQELQEFYPGSQDS